MGNLSFNKIDVQFLKKIALNDDFTEALIEVQEAVGQDDGGIASIHFSAFEEDENGNIILWNKKEDESVFDLLVRRMSIIQSYIEAEKAYDYLSY